MIETKKFISSLKEIVKEKDNSNFEIDIIISFVLKKSKIEWMFEKELPNNLFRKCAKIAKKRASGVPLQYLISEWEFYGIPIKINRGVLIPRPETEILVATALKLAKKNANILDLCTGSGCISAAISKMRPDVSITAVDVSRKAIKISKKNLYKFKNIIKLIRGDVLNKKFAKKFENFDLIVCNPPYLSKKDMKNIQTELTFEPKIALFGGSDGLIFYKAICSGFWHSLKKGGFLAFEIGFNQKNLVSDILIKNNFKNITTVKDFSSNDRVVFAQI